MQLRASRAHPVVAVALALCIIGVPLSSSTAEAQQKLELKPVADKKLAQLPAGPLFWQVQNFSTLARAQAAAGETSLAAEVAGKAWLFTLGPMGGSRPGGSKVVEIGPVPPITAPEYLLCIDHASGPPGAKMPVHAYPGSEAFFVLTGRLDQVTPHSVRHVWAGQSMPGHGVGTSMQVLSLGTSDLNAFIMFVADATKPFSSLANFE